MVTITSELSVDLNSGRPAAVSTAILLVIALAGVMMTITPTSGNSHLARDQSPTVSTGDAIEALARPIVAPDLSSPSKFSAVPPPKMSRNCSVDSLRTATVFNEAVAQFKFQSKPWCGMTFPLTASYLQKRLKGKKILFLGDSVVRNSFVVIMSKLCNEKNMFKCMIRMPTHEYDMVKTANTSGPMGCVPGDSGLVSQCYREGKFAFVPLKGLTTKSMPRDRTQRRTFINKGLIGPAVHMHFGGVDLIYLPVNRPNQIAKTASWIASPWGEYLRADYTLVSIGPHLKLPEVRMTPYTFNESIGALRRALGPRAPIVVAEFVHALKSQPSYIEEVDKLMVTIAEVLAHYNVPVVPQRHVTRYGYQLMGFDVEGTEKMPRPAGSQCGYYDPQHPALRCQAVGTDLLLAAALSLD